jgi:hypothetical protein
MKILHVYNLIIYNFLVGLEPSTLRFGGEGSTTELPPLASLILSVSTFYKRQKNFLENDKI